MNNEPNKPIEAEELTEKELEGVVGGDARSTNLTEQIIKINKNLIKKRLNEQTVEATYQFAR